MNLPEKVYLQSPIFDQGNINSSTACATAKSISEAKACEARISASKASLLFEYYSKRRFPEMVKVGDLP